MHFAPLREYKYFDIQMTEKIITTLGELEAFITHNKIVLIYFHKV